jgi:stage V sporulation protein D (sporulation-specific penicillin-binding protein)
MEPYIVAQVVDGEGNTVLCQEPTPVRRTVSEETSKTMCELIRSVVTDGTAKNAAVAGFDIGGKTGTSEKIDVFDENGQRVLDKIVSCVGIAPMNDPRYIVLVALDTPSRATGLYISGGVMAAPTVGAVMADILPYLEVPSTPGTCVDVPNLRGLTVEQAEKELKKIGLTAVSDGGGAVITDQLPEAGSSVYTGTQVLIYLKESPLSEGDTT